MAAKTKSAHAGRRGYKHKPRGVSDRVFEKAHWPYLPVLMVALFLISVSAHTGVLQAAVRNPSSSVLAYSTAMSTGGLLSSTNSARVSEGAAALQLNSKLNAAAQAKAEDMANRNYWSHNTPEGNPPWIFVSAQNYSYQKLGENLAAGFSDEQATINGWLASPPHKENLMDPSFSEVGFGFANNPDYTSAGGGPMTIVVAFYGKPVGAAAPAPAPTASQGSSAKKPTPTPSSGSAAAPAPAQPAPESSPAPSTPLASLPQQPQAETPRPATTDNPRSGVSLAVRTSRAQVAFAKLPVSSFATGLSTFGMLAAAGFFISHHTLAIRRAWARSESFAFKHPFLDLSLVVIAGLSYLLTRTAGFIQ